MRMSVRSLTIAVGLLATADGALAQSSWGGLYPSIFVTTDYRYDGASFTGHEPTVQGSLYWTRTDDLYAGVWVSGVDFSDLGDTTTSYEVDVYGGRNFDFGRTRLTLEGMYSSFPDNETPGPTYDFVTLRARVMQSLDALSFGGSLSYVPEASYRSGHAWRLKSETAYRWNDWLTTSASLGRRWSATQLERSFFEVAATATWNKASFSLRYSDTNQSFVECGFIDWCESGVTLTLQVDLWE